MDIAVVGCGTAGPAAAALLRERGHDVVIFEREPAPRPVGSGIMVQPLGMSVLDRLGVGDEIRRLGNRVDRLHGVNAQGRTILDVRYGDMGEDVCGVGVQRGLLFSTLLSRAERSGASVCTGWAIDRIDDAGPNGVWVIDERGRRAGPFACIVIASGSRTLLRSAIGEPRRCDEYPWGAWWFTALAGGVQERRTLFQSYEHAERMVGFLPSGKLTDAGADTVSCFYSVERAREREIRQRGIAWLRDDVRRLAPGFASIAEQLVSWDQVLVATYRDVVMRPLCRGRVVCIGDAGHSMSPQLGLGANLALVDALVLARCLGDVDQGSSSDEVERALTAFSDQRRRVLRYYAFISRLLTPLFQSSERSLAVVRDLALPVLCRAGWSRRQMLEAVCGTTGGFLGRW